MTDKVHSNLAPELVTESPAITLEDLCTACSVSSQEILTYVSEGIIQPLEPGGDQRYFSQISIIEVRRAKRLEADLGLNAAGIALAFELVAQIETLRRRLARYQVGQTDGLDQS
ncbi:MAG TPA: chaperone modulator CbpM [Hyphomicrobiaceae bacterium]|nr:chaperone modulator CbpM [Hyphomicrobiaceae bacterium]